MYLTYTCLKLELKTFAVTSEAIANKLSGELGIMWVALTCLLRFVFDFGDDSEKNMVFICKLEFQFSLFHQKYS